MPDSLELVKQWLRAGDGGLLGSQGAVLGVDIGSYGLRAIVADLQGLQVHGAGRSLPDGNAETITEAGITLVRELLESSGMQARRLLRIGIGFGGPVDADAGLTRIHHRRPGWESFPLAERFEAAFDTQALIDNDANVIALGEACCIAGRDVHDLFYLHLSTGVGGGMVLDGRLYNGAATTAGEIGHAIVRADGARCSCGGRGHLEAYVSVGALLRRLGELGLETNEIGAIFGDSEAARQTVSEATDLLGITLANVVAMIDPQMIVVGGIVARTGGEQWLATVGQKLNELLPPTLAHGVEVVPSTFNHESVAVGALALAFNSLQE